MRDIRREQQKEITVAPYQKEGHGRRRYPKEPDGSLREASPGLSLQGARY